jgi:Domain of unknown function (DUF4390)
MMVSMVSIMRCLPIALSLVLAACGGDRRGSAIRSAVFVDGQLTLDLDLRFSDTHLAALDHGIPLRLALAVDGGQPRLVTLRFRPLARQYELQFSDEAGPRLHASRARMLAALDRIVIGNVTATAGRVHIALDRSALPAPLRLPALIGDEWQLETAPMHWGN